MSDAQDKVIEYARNVDALWNQPRQDTATGQATHAIQLSRGFDLLREAIDELDKEKKNK